MRNGIVHSGWLNWYMLGIWGWVWMWSTCVGKSTKIRICVWNMVFFCTIGPWRRDRAIAKLIECRSRFQAHCTILYMRENPVKTCQSHYIDVWSKGKSIDTQHTKHGRRRKSVMMFLVVFTTPFHCLWQPFRPNYIKFSKDNQKWDTF